MKSLYKKCGSIGLGFLILVQNTYALLNIFFAIIQVSYLFCEVFICYFLRRFDQIKLKEISIVDHVPVIVNYETYVLNLVLRTRKSFCHYSNNMKKMIIKKYKLNQN